MCIYIIIINFINMEWNNRYTTNKNKQSILTLDLKRLAYLSYISWYKLWEMTSWELLIHYSNSLNYDFIEIKMDEFILKRNNDKKIHEDLCKVLLINEKWIKEILQNLI